MSASSVLRFALLAVLCCLVLEVTSEKACVRGSSYFDGCNYCYCNPHGPNRCTYRACDSTGDNRGNRRARSIIEVLGGQLVYLE